MKVSFYLESPKGVKRNPEGTNPTAIFARIWYEGYVMKYYTPENILPKFWNGKAKPHRAKETAKFSEYPEFNKRLDNIEAAIKNAIRKYTNDNGNKPPAPATLKPLLDIAIRDDGKVKRETLLTFFDRFIEECKAGIKTGKHGKPITAGTIKSYVTTKAILTDYQSHIRKELSFDSIDMLFFNEFTKYLTLVKKQAANYIHKNFAVIKTVLKYATDLKINTNRDFESSRFSAPTEETESIYLPEYELKEIAELDLTKDLPLDRVRDLFLIGCYTGLRFSDLSTLHPDNIKDGMITITQIKTGRPVAIPVHSKVNEIMVKYSGLLPKSLSNQKMNDALKDVAKQCKSLKKKVSITFTKAGKTVTKAGKDTNEAAEKWQFVTTHTARRSFATNQYLNKVPVITIMAITGHRTESAFMKYIKVAPVEHANILQENWNNQKIDHPKTIAI